MIRFLAFWLLAGICQYPFFKAFLFFEDSFLNTRLAQALALYLLSLVFLFFSVPKDHGWFHAQRLWGRTSLGFFSWFPLIGWLSLLGHYLYVSFHPKPLVLPADQEFLLPQTGLAGIDTTLLSKRDRLVFEMDLMPLGDILTGTDVALKRGAIERLAEIKTPEAVSVLLEFRSDNSAEVRFFITSALTRIKSEFEEQIQAAKKELQKDIYQWNTRLLLGRIYSQYTQSGLLDEITRDQFEKEAIFHLNYAVNAGDVTEDAATLLLKVHQHRQEWAEMTTVLDTIEVKKLLSDVALQQWKSEVHYEQAEYTLLKEDLRRLAQNKVLSSEWLTQISWWCAT